MRIGSSPISGTKNGVLENKDLEGTVNPLIPKGSSSERYRGASPFRYSSMVERSAVNRLIGVRVPVPEPKKQIIDFCKHL